MNSSPSHPLSPPSLPSLSLSLSLSKKPVNTTHSTSGVLYGIYCTQVWPRLIQHKTKSSALFVSLYIALHQCYI